MRNEIKKNEKFKITPTTNHFNTASKIKKKNVKEKTQRNVFFVVFHYMNTYFNHTIFISNRIELVDACRAHERKRRNEKT